MCILGIEMQRLFRLPIILNIIAALSSCRTVNMAVPPDTSEKAERRLIVTADDFAAMQCIDEGIIEAIERGFITTVSTLVTFPRSSDALRDLADRYPEIPIGLHVSITSGYPVSDIGDVPSLVDQRGRFYSINQLIPILDKVDINELIREINAQIDVLESLDIKIDHLSNQHNIISLYTPFFAAFSDIARSRGFPLRSTVPLSLADPNYSGAMTKVRGYELGRELAAENLFKAAGFRKYATLEEMTRNQKSMRDIPHPDYLVDGFWGTPTPENLLFLLGNLPEGTGEIVFHLGRYNEEETAPWGIESEYLLMREFELACISSDFPARWMDTLGIESIGFSDLE